MSFFKKEIKDELRNIINGNESTGSFSQLEKTQKFLRRNAQAGFKRKEKQYFKDEEEAILIKFAHEKNILFYEQIQEARFIRRHF